MAETDDKAGGLFFDRPRRGGLNRVPLPQVPRHRPEGGPEPSAGIT
jgi:hypothetical protein